MKNTPETFWKKVAIREPESCWMWLGGHTSDGYGSVSYQGKNQSASRVAFLLSGGQLEPGQVVMHSCDNRGCCNPKHLSSGTVADNNLDMVAKGRLVVSFGGRNGSRVHLECRPRGTSNKTAKLSDESVAAMRKLRANGMTYSAIASQFGVHVSTAHRAVTRRLWNHVDCTASAAKAKEAKP